MASIREIQGRMKGIQDTRKITNAMYLISSTKLKKARQDLENTEPYFEALQSIISRLMQHIPDSSSKYLSDVNPDEVVKEGTDEEDEGNVVSSRVATSEEEKVEPKKAYIVVTADKGLAGSYNHNILKIAHEKIQNDPNARLFVIGEVGRQYFRARHIEVDPRFLYTAQNPSLHRARSIVKGIIALYNSREIDELHIIYTKMKSTMSMESELVRLLPLDREAFTNTPEGEEGQNLEEVTLSPSFVDALSNIIPNYITGFVYSALVESYCCEQNARMMAMSAANDNAEEMLHSLKLEFNRVRQAMITQEITEIISGAKALKASQNALEEGGQQA